MLANLIDELVNDVPEPLNGQLEIERTLGRQDGVEQLHVVTVRLETLLQRWSALMYTADTNKSVYFHEKSTKS